jgi:hypothetical protein
MTLKFDMIEAEFAEFNVHVGKKITLGGKKWITYTLF